MNKSVLFSCGLLLIFSLSIYACTEDEGEGSEYIIQTAIGKPVSFQDTVSINDSIELRVRIGTPNPCYLFDGYNYYAQQNKMSVSFYTKYKKNESCIQVPGRIDTLIKLKLFREGPNIITFNPNTNFEIVDTIFVTN